MASHDDLIQQFASVCEVDPAMAAEYLERTDWDLDTAVAGYFHDVETSADDPETPAVHAAAEPEAYTGPRTLDGRPAPQAAAPAASAKRPPPKKTGIATLSSLNSGGASSSHDHDGGDGEDDADDDPSRNRGDLFAGGEKSGLAVQDPSAGARRLIDDIVRQARTNAERSSAPDADSPAAAGAAGAGSAASRYFRGSGQTVGGEGTASRVIPGSAASSSHRSAAAAGAAAESSATEGPVQERTLHLWSNGFSIDDGPLFRYDDPANASNLAMIRNGRAPLELMEVSFDQALDVQLMQHDEEWHQLPRVYRPFGGAGRRLGSPMPGEPAVPIREAEPAPSSAGPTAAAASDLIQVNDSEPVLTLRIQLPNGARVPVRLNPSHTVEDVYRVIQMSSPEVSTRPWVLASTFPSQEHTDRSLKLGDMAPFKRGGTAVVKWV